MSFWRNDWATRDALAGRRDRQIAGRDRIQDGRDDHHRQPEFPRRARLSARGNQGQASFDVRDAGGARQRRISRVLGQSQPRRIPGGGIQADRPRAAARSGFRPPTIRYGQRDKPYKVIKFATDITAKKIRSMEDAGKIAAIARAQAVIEFNLDGTIITANDNFLAAVGYSLAEIQGKHHSMFVGAGRARQRRLSRVLGEPQPRRIPVGRIQAVRQGRQGSLDSRLLQSDPRRDRQAVQGGEVRHRRQRAETEDREFRRPDRGDRQVAGGDRVRHGRQGADRERELPRRARLFAGRNPGQASQHVRAPAERDSEAYREFWASLNRGEFQSGEYRRIGKGGREIWIQASYNPIRDLNGKPYKVVKYASDTTAQVIARKRSEKVRGMMESVAAGAEELNASVREISEAMVKSKETALDGGRPGRGRGSAGAAAERRRRNR